MTDFNYTILKDFCKVRNLGDAYRNGIEYTPRMIFIMNLLKSLNIDYNIDTFTQASATSPAAFGFKDDELKVLEMSTEELTEIIEKKKIEVQELFKESNIMIPNQDLDLRNPNYFSMFFERRMSPEIRKKMYELDTEMFLYQDALTYKKKLVRLNENKLFNIILPGTSSIMFIAHHDIKNPDIDNCNDNSASIINLIALKLLVPEATIVFTDGEELGGIGADRLATKIKENTYGNIRWVVNLELTAVGGTNFIVGRKRNSLYNHIRENFECEPFDDTTARSDASILHERGIQSCVITTLPKVDGKLNYDLIRYCHGTKDTIELANYDDMKDFVEKVLVKIIKT